MNCWLAVKCKKRRKRMSWKRLLHKMYCKRSVPPMIRMTYKKPKKKNRIINDKTNQSHYKLTMPLNQHHNGHSFTSDLNQCKRKQKKRHRKFSNEFIAMKMFLFLQIYFLHLLFIYIIPRLTIVFSMILCFVQKFYLCVSLFYLSLCPALPQKIKRKTMISTYNSTTEMPSRGFYLWSFART